MPSSREHFALDWIKADLLETLNEARVALDEYAEGPGDELRLRTCLTNVHQVHGTLVMLELEGVTLLADHMEQLSQAMLSNQIGDMSAAGQCLMQGILELPGYLDELQRGAEDSASPTLPLVNEMRSLLNLSPLTDQAGASLTASVNEEAVQKFNAIDGQQKVGRIRTAYQTVLLSILKGEDRGAAVETLTKIGTGLQRVCAGTPLERQWQAFGEFVTSLSYQQGALESEAVKLLRRVDVEIKNLARDGDVALRAPVNMELVQQLLDAAESREHNTEVMAGLRQAVERDVSHNTLAISGRQALSSAAQALQEELGSVKDRLDILVRSSQVDLAELRQLVGPLKQIGSTLSLLGFESSREIIADQIDAIESLVVLGDGDPQGVQSIAGALVQIDENLSSVVQGSEKTEVEQITGEAQLQVLRESRAGLDEVKQSIVDFVTAHFDARHLEGVPGTLAGIRGALEIIPLPRVIELLQLTEQYVVGRLAQGHQPDWQALDMLADGISAVDYYLERLAEENSSGIDEILAVAQRSFDELLGDSAAEAEAPAAEDATLADVEVADQPAAETAAAPDDEELPAGVDPIPVFTEAGADSHADSGAEAEADSGAEAEMLQAETDEPAAAAPEDDYNAIDYVAPELEPDAGLEAAQETAQVAAHEAAHGEAQESSQGEVPDAAEEAEAPEVRAERDPAADSIEYEAVEASGGGSEHEAAQVSGDSSEPEEAEAAGESIESFDLSADIFSDVEGVVDVEPEPQAESAAEPLQADTQAELEPAVEDPAAGMPEVDTEIVEIFVEEVAEVVEGIDEWLPQWAANLEVGEPITELRRAFHTLKGSGRIVHAVALGELAWGIENMLNRVMDNTVSANPQFVEIVTQARDLIPELADAFENGEQGDLNAIAAIIEQADLLASGGEVAAGPDSNAAAAASAPVEPEPPAAEAAADSADDNIPGLDAELPELEPAADDSAWLNERFADESAQSGNAFDLFVAEAREHLQVVDEENAKVPWRLTEAMARAFHTLAGSSAIAGISQVQLIAEPTYQVVEAFRGKDNVTGLQSFLSEAAGHMRSCFEALAADADWEEPFEFVAQADDLLARQPSKMSAAQQLLEAQATADILDGEEKLRAYLLGDTDTCADMLNALADLSSTANGLGEKNLAELATAFMQILTNATIAGRVPDNCVPVMQLGYDRLIGQLNTLAAGGDTPDEADTIEQLLALDFTEDAIDLSDLDVITDDEPVPDTIEVPEDSLLDDLSDMLQGADEPVDASAEAQAKEQAGEQVKEQAKEAVKEQANEQIEVPEPAAGSQQAGAYDDLDPDLIDVFFEEADEICEELESAILSWSQETDNRIYMETMLRGLHTFKGGARLCGLVPLGDLAHDFESCVIEIQNEERAVDEDLFTDLNRRYDQLTAQLQDVRNQVLGGAQPAAAAFGGEPAGAEPPAADPVAAAQTDTARDTEDAPAQPAAAPAEDALQAATDSLAAAAAAQPAPQPAVPPPAEAPTGKERSSQEMVRVGSTLLEELVNLAGENSILRARIEQGMADFTGSLDEMETTIERLREQLRRLEIETETQILYRHEGPQYENFDPLEMDRYSQLQQLSKSLSESASDMLDLKDTLLFKARESETLLLQQARINTELQEGLMRTRMVPFSRLLPRLRRIVRQVSSELGKEVEFHVQNAEGELDRNLLERMVPPLEHMLRNAVDHGIESGELRRNFGKPANGRIDLRLSREGGDVVIEISDDGAGVDVESVRAKAVERELIQNDANLSDDEVIQFILAPGFSTAKSVTQISGRGVGMDVVHSEVKQLGGSISILSRPGKGTRFILRVPFTVSVNRALMVSVAEDLYAIPLNTIEGIVLLNPEQLQDLYASEGKTFEYAGTPYRVRYLGHYLGREYHGLAPGHASVPMVLVRSGDHAVAIHVDLVQGSREIVVKSLGPQFAGVGGISGATILGDGSVVVILDLLALIRAQQHQRRAKPRSTQSKPGPRCVLVVDDSVTVRKVTSRLLERQGMDVLVAKDGIEAVALLQERRPDVMLLDIEMPRMDGFEVARQVRHDERLGNLPIVMISSRTGDKHKEHASQLGVNKFLGKPFQENELLATIDELVSRI